MVSLNSGLLLIASAAVASTRGAAIAVTPGTSTLGLTPAADVCAPIWTQCTSQNLFWVGPDCCEGSVCVVLNPFWSQCLAPTTTVDSIPDEYELVCGAEIKRRHTESLGISPYPQVSPPRHLPQILPLPLDEVGPRVIAETSNTGCGTKINLRASPGHRMWVLRGSARTVVPLSAEYFTEEKKRALGGVPRMEVCGCTIQGVGCCVCGNALGVYHTHCSTHLAASSHPYIFLPDSVSPPLPLGRHKRRRVLRIESRAVAGDSGTTIATTERVATPTSSPLRFEPTPAPANTRDASGAAVTPERSFSFASWMRERYERPRTPQTLRDLEAEAEEMEAAAAELYAEAEEQDARRAVATAQFHAVHGRTQGARTARTIEEMNAWAAAALGRGRGEPHPHERPRGEGGSGSER
ncbi:hypothetical protein B0H14DRAFT_2580222 [Mycena olivaceomarginata]|nr:hypothetical protein B0H14DRAFT_2580222 [Mycena olivaceomarginata]